MDIPDWLLDATDGITVAQVIIWLIIIGSGFWVIRKAWPGLKALVALAQMIETLMPMMTTLRDLPDWQTQTTSMLGRLRKQVENSHNTNLRDDITKALEIAKATADSVEGVHGRLDKLETNDVEQERILTDMRGKLGRDHKRITVIEETMPRDELGRFTKRKEAEDE